jgi:hypothetical protein
MAWRSVTRWRGHRVQFARARHGGVLVGDDMAADR